MELNIPIRVAWVRLLKCPFFRQALNADPLKSVSCEAPTLRGRNNSRPATGAVEFRIQESIQGYFRLVEIVHPESSLVQVK